MNTQGIIGSANIFISYFLLIIVLSSFILKPRFRDENIFKRFIIYLVFGNLYVSSLVFILSYLGVWNKPVLIIFILISSIILRFVLNITECKKTLTYIRDTISNLILGKYGFRLFISDMYEKTRAYIVSLFNELTKGKKLEWLIFLILIAYNVYQYGVNNINFTTYLAPDEEVHLYWIQSLLGGEIYPSGVYPHVFHNILAALIEIFNINAMTMIEFFSITSVVFIMTLLYMGLRKVFNSKYAALFGLLMFTLGNFFIEEATRRYQFTIPQEYAMFMLMPLAIFLFDYIKTKDIKDLLFFSLSLSLTVSIHFYTGIIGVFLTMSIIFVYFLKIIRERLTLKIILSCILSALIALAPLATGLALGHEMEQSMSWATDVIKGEIYSGTSTDDRGLLIQEKEKSEEELIEEELEKNRSTEEKIKIDIIKYGFTSINLAYFFIITIILIIIYNTVLIILKKNNEKNIYKIIFAVNSLLLFLLIMFKALGLPTIMEPKRVTIYFAYFSPILFGMPVEFLISLFKGRARRFVTFVSLGLMGMALFLIIYTNNIRPIPRLYYFQTSGTMKANYSIMRDYEDFTWTAVSPVNNISSVMNNGYHYELSDFIMNQENWNKDKETFIPTPYVFVYIEKRPIRKYGFDFNRFDREIVGRKLVSREDAIKDFSIEAKPNYSYTDERNILMSKAYYWAKEYKKYFPKEMNVYYEDDELIVYRIKQNMYALNNFNIDYKINRKEV